VLYFVTTNGFGQPSRLYQATFVDIANRAIRRRSSPASCWQCSSTIRFCSAAMAMIRSTAVPATTCCSVSVAAIG